jgi:hypothetical protein
LARRALATWLVVLGAWAVLLAPLRVAVAAEGDGESGGDDRVAIAFFLIESAPLAPGPRALLWRSLEASLKKNRRVDVKDKDLLLADFGGEVPEAAVQKARGLFNEGAALLDEGNPAAAVPKLVAAESAFEPVLAFVKKNELADAQFLLGVAHALAGDKKKARAAFVRLQVWRVGYQWDVEKYAQVLPLWQAAHDDVARIGRGSIEVVTEPEGAMAFVDGKYVGATPTSADALPVGDHFVTLKLEGYQRRVVKAHVDPRYQEVVSETLVRSEKYLLVDQSLARAKDALGRTEADVSMVDLRTFLFLDMAVFVHVAPGDSAGIYVLDAYLYDLRSKRLLSQVRGAEVAGDADAAAMDAATEPLFSALFASVSYEGKAPAVVSKRKKVEPPAKTPLYKKTWFWVAVGAGVALVATPIIFKDELFPADEPGCSSGQVCTGVSTSF